MDGVLGAPAHGARRSRAADALSPAEIAAGDDLSLLRALLLIRRFEEKAGQLFAMGEIGGFCHLSVGQESVAVGLRRAMRAGDRLIAAHRHHGHLLAAGADPAAVMAELTGRAAGLSRGKGGSIHMFAPELGYFGGHGVAGAPASIGVGLAFAQKFRDDGGATVACFGDASADQGQVAESFNMAARWRLPILFVVENNGGGEDFSRRGAGFDILGESVDASDVLGVAAAADAALAQARAGEPRLLDLRISRWRGHFGAANGNGKNAAPNDAVERLRQKMRADGVEAGVLRRVEAECREAVARAAAFALAAPEPDESALTEDIFAAEVAR